MKNPSKMTTAEIYEEVSAEDAMTTMQKGFLEVMYELENLLIRGITEPKFYGNARIVVRRTIKELVPEVYNQN